MSRARLQFFLIFFLFFAAFLALSFRAAPAQAAYFPNCASGCNVECKSNHQNYPVDHQNINLEVCSYEQIPKKSEGLVYFKHQAPKEYPPQFGTLIEGNSSPKVANLYQMCDWDVTASDRGRLSQLGKPSDAPDDFASLVGFQTTAGQKILVPQSGHDIGSGRQVMVLYATATSITLKYTAEDDVVGGYTVNLDNLDVDPELLAEYEKAQSEKRKDLPRRCGSQIVGIAKSGEIRVAIQDAGSFLDPRWYSEDNDWWQIKTAAKAAGPNECPSVLDLIGGGRLTRTSKIGKDGPLYGRDPYDRLNITGNTSSSVPDIGNMKWRYSKEPYCPAIGINNDEVMTAGLTQEEYKYCLLDESKRPISGKKFISCPDYSPNRPYPGDTCIDYLELKDYNITKFSQPAKKSTTTVTYDLCKCDLKVAGVCFDVSCLPKEHSVVVWQTDNVSYPNAFVDYLGTNNEYSSNPNYIMSLKNDIMRSNLFLTDFLRGFFTAPGDGDRSREMYDFLQAQNDFEAVQEKYKNVTELSEAQTAELAKAMQEYQEKISKIPNLKERMQLTSGVIAKLYSEAYKEKEYDSNEILLNRWLYANLPQGDASRPDDKIDRTAVGDYVIGYKCENDAKPVNEEDFDDSLERRKGKSGKGTPCKSISPLRISDYVCGNITANNDFFNQPEAKGLDRGEICRGKKEHFSDDANWTIFWKDFFPIATREDTPVRVTIKCPSLELPITTLHVKPDAGEYTEKELRDKKIDTYAVKTGRNDDLNQDTYDIYHRLYVYVGHLAEARETVYYASNALLPRLAQIEKAKELKKVEMTLPDEIAEGKVVSAPVTTGDLVAQDSSLYYTKKYGALDAQMPINRTIGKHISWDGSTWNGNGKPPQNTVVFSDDGNFSCEINVEMPFIKELAVRTIGKETGFMREFLPAAVAEQIDKEMEEAENKGANVAAAKYETGAKEILSPSKEWNTHAEVAMDDNGRFYVPWVKQMEAYQKYLAFALNPQGAQTLSGAVVDELDKTATGKGTTWCPTPFRAVAPGWPPAGGEWDKASQSAAETAAEAVGKKGDANFIKGVKITIDGVKETESGSNLKTECTYVEDEETKVKKETACGPCQFSRETFSRLTGEMLKLHSDVYKKEDLDDILDYAKCAKAMAYFFATKDEVKCLAPWATEAEFNECFTTYYNGRTVWNKCPAQAKSIWDYAQGAK